MTAAVQHTQNSFFAHIILRILNLAGVKSESCVLRLNSYSLRFCFQKINSEKYHDIWVDNLELIDSYGDIIDAIIDILKVQKDERYGGQNKNFNQTHDIMVPHGIECASKHKLLPIYVLPRYESKS